MVGAAEEVMMPPEPTSTQMMAAIVQHHRNDIEAVVTRFRGVESKLEAGQQKFDCIERKLDAQAEDIARVREIAEALEGLKTLGKICGWFSLIGGFLAGAWVVGKTLVMGAFR